MSSSVGEVTERLENELWRWWSDGKVREWVLILQSFHRFTYDTAHSPMTSAHSPTCPSLHQRHSSFSNPSVALATSQLILQWAQLILQPFRLFTNVTAHSPILPSLYLRHSSFSNELCSFSNPSFASPMPQGLHLRHLASCPCYEYSCILLRARTRKVFTTLPIPAVAFKETTNSPSPPLLRSNIFVGRFS